MERGTGAHLGVHVLQLPPFRKHVAIELCVPPVVLPHLLFQSLVHKFHIPDQHKTGKELVHHVSIADELRKT